MKFTLRLAVSVENQSGSENPANCLSEAVDWSKKKNRCLKNLELVFRAKQNLPNCRWWLLAYEIIWHTFLHRSMRGNLLSSVSDVSFASLLRLRSLDLSSNLVTSVPVAALRRVARLETLWVWRCFRARWVAIRLSFAWWMIICFVTLFSLWRQWSRVTSCLETISKSNLSWFLKIVVNM